MKKIASILFIIMLTTSGMIIITSFTPSTVSAYTPHAPIYIDGNADFFDIDDDGVINPSAAGTESDPYIIEGWEIDASTAIGIEIRNTNVYFIINYCYVHNGGINYDGIYFNTVENGIIENCNISNNRDGVNLISSSYSNTISNNTISSNSDDGISLSLNSGNLIYNNSISNNNDGIELSESSSNIISKNNIYSHNNYGIYLSTSSNSNIISKNNIYFNKKDGVYLISSWSNTVSNNTIHSNTEDGIWLRSSSGSNTISNNSISNNRYGIFLYLSSSNTVSNNSVYSNYWDGIILDTSSDHTISNNTLYSNNDDGLTLGLSTDNTISNNTIYSNEDGGINLYGNSDGNIIIYNTMGRNIGYGIYITASNLNYIHHNIFEHNNGANDTYNPAHIQAYDTGTNNLWNDSYPSGGNYWCDYNGINLNSTPTQDVPPPDDFGDTPYIIDSDSQDNYPFMEPFENFTFLYPGWNLISLPLIQSDINLDKVLSSIKGYYKAVQWYNTTDTRDHWKHNTPLKPTHLNDLNGINHIMGFWIYISEPGGVLFKYLGNLPTINQIIPLNEGWNMVGYPSLTSYNRTVGLNNLTFGDHVDAIWNYDSATQRWEEMGESDHFKIGRGYYIHAKIKCEWEVPL